MSSMLKMPFITLLFSLLLVDLSIAGYVLEDDYSPSNFFDQFTFFTDTDPTDGFVDYVDQATAQSAGYISNTSSSVYIGTDSENVTPDGRPSVRITSNKSYNTGTLVILDLEHMPGGICGTWPAFWMVGPDWPYGGEIDIIEGVNLQTENEMTLHTSDGCTITNDGNFTGTLLTDNCYIDAADQSYNAGCSIDSDTTTSYGTGFNDIGGGVFATEWTDSGISIWFFPRGSIPSDISSGSPSPGDAWGEPSAQFQGGCDIPEFFSDNQIVFDLTFCGDWAGEVWDESTCSSYASTCDAYVENNPSAFADAYWTINSLKVYAYSSSSSSSSSSASSSSAASSSSVAASSSVIASSSSEAVSSTASSSSAAADSTASTAWWVEAQASSSAASSSEASSTQATSSEASSSASSSADAASTTAAETTASSAATASEVIVTVNGGTSWTTTTIGTTTTTYADGEATSSASTSEDTTSTTAAASTVTSAATISEVIVTVNGGTTWTTTTIGTTTTTYVDDSEATSSASESEVVVTVTAGTSWTTTTIGTTTTTYASLSISLAGEEADITTTAATTTTDSTSTSSSSVRSTRSATPPWWVDAEATPTSVWEVDKRDEVVVPVQSTLSRHIVQLKSSSQVERDLEAGNERRHLSQHKKRFGGYH